MSQRARANRTTRQSGTFFLALLNMHRTLPFQLQNILLTLIHIYYQHGFGKTIYRSMRLRHRQRLQVQYHIAVTSVQITILSLMFPTKVKKASAKAFVFRRNRRIIPLEVICHLYKAYIFPHLEYCCPLLLGVGKGQVKKTRRHQ